MNARSGYSGKPLWQKLGIKPGMKLRLCHAPEAYFTWAGRNMEDMIAGKNEVPDLLHLFAINAAVFESEMKKCKPLLQKNRNLVIWVSWYKKSSRMQTDLSEDLIRAYALANGLVDVKVCAVSEQWSALKLVVPLKLR